MRGHIRKRGNKYVAVIDIGKDPASGKRKQKWLSGFNTKKAAERAANEFINKYEKGLYTDTKNIVLKDYLIYWLEDHAAMNVSPSTLSSYEDTVYNNLIPALGMIKLNDLRAHHIQSFLSKLIKEQRLSSTTIRYYYKVLNIALNKAIELQMLFQNPCSVVTPPKKNKKEMSILNQEQSNILLENSVNTPFYIPIVLGLTTGLRRGEVCGLKWKNVNFEENVIHITNNRIEVHGKIIEKAPKTDKGSRSIHISNSTAEILKKEKKQQLVNKVRLGPKYDDNDYVVCWEDGSPYRPDYLTKAVPNFIEKLGLPRISFHELRHTHASLLLPKVNPKIVQERLGHSSIKITLDTYSHLLQTMQKDAANELDNIFNITSQKG